MEAGRPVRSPFEGSREKLGFLVQGDGRRDEEKRGIRDEFGR